MSSLSVYHVSSAEMPNKVLTHLEDIASTLAEHGVTFDRWQAETPIAPGATEEALIGAYRTQIDRLMTERGYLTVDVVSAGRDPSQRAERHAGPLEERQYAEDEVRFFFVAGRGLFSLHIGDFVYAVLCERNDLIGLPAGTRHWFDGGENPYFVALRLCKGGQGAEATLTGDDIASQFPRLED